MNKREYQEYIKPFAPRSKCLHNAVRAFVTGGALCCAAYFLQEFIIDRGVSEEEAGTYVTLVLVAAAQFLTGVGVFDMMVKFAGAGLNVPITGFANSIVAPVMEFKKEGLVLGAGSKLFSVAGPVILIGVSASTIVGLIYWIFGL